MKRRGRTTMTSLGPLLVVMTVAWVFVLSTAAEATNLVPMRSFPIPPFPDPDINVNGLAYGEGKLFALNTFWDPITNSSQGKIYVLDPDDGSILDSFSSAFGGGLASDGASLYLNAYRPVEGDIIRFDPTNGSVLQTIRPSGVTITGGVGGLAFLEGDLFQVAATVECQGVSVVRLEVNDGTFLGCFSVHALGYDTRELGADGTHLLYGTSAEGGFTVFTLSPTGAVLGADVLTSVSQDTRALACGDNELFAADRGRNQIDVFSFPCPAVITVEIDIKPGSSPNPVNLKSKGKIPIAILTTDTFDATTIDPTKVLFGATGIEATPVHSALEDVDRDGATDMILHFKTQDTGIHCGDIEVKLVGETYSGQVIEGIDSISIVGCKPFPSSP